MRRVERTKLTYRAPRPAAAFQGNRCRFDSLLLTPNRDTGESDEIAPS